jgi:hypothetical protein
LDDGAAHQREPACGELARERMPDLLDIDRDGAPENVTEFCEAR